MSDEFDRIKRLPPYVFEEVNRLKADLRAKGKDIIDFGMGNPDMPTPKHIREKLKETVEKPGTGRYSSSRGIPGLRKAQAAYYKRRFNVDLNPENEVIVTLGSKEGLANLAQAITSPGDIILSPNPSYPIHPYGFIIAGASLRHLPAMDEGIFNPNLYLERLEKSIKESVPAPVALIISFPSNPTAQVASLDFYEEVVKIALKYNVYILSDLAYAEIYYDDFLPPSILQIPKAKEIAVEFTSTSKTAIFPFSCLLGKSTVNLTMSSMLSATSWIISIEISSSFLRASVLHFSSSLIIFSFNTLDPFSRASATRVMSSLNLS